MNHYIRIAVALAFATLCTLLTQYAFRDKDIKPFVVSFLAYSETKCPLQLFYTESEGEEFTDQKLVISNQLVGQSPTYITFTIPVKHIHSLRLDLDIRPKAVSLTAINISGDDQKTLVCDHYSECYFIDDVRLEPSGYTTFISDKEDPIIIFRNVDMESKQHSSAFYLYLASLFILSCAIFYWLTGVFFRISGDIGWHNAAFLLLFALFLLIPGSHISTETISESEKRTLATHPEISDLASLDNYGKAYDRWINDHFCGREQLLKVHSMFSSLESYRSKTAFEGKDKWFFLAENPSMRNYANIDTFNNTQLINIANTLESMDYWCKKNGKRFYFVINPDKHKVYGEYYKYVNKIRPDSVSRANQVVKYLKTHTNVDCIYTLDSLLKAKEETGELIYYKDDTHWNHFGSYFGYRDIMHHIQKDYDIPINEVITFSTDYPTKRGDLSITLPAAGVDTTFLPKYPDYTKGNYTTGEKEGTNFHAINPEGKYRLLMYGDSFTNHVIYPFTRTFYETSRATFDIRFLPSDKEKEFILNTFNPDVIILLIVERNLQELSDAIASNGLQR